MNNKLVKESIFYSFDGAVSIAAEHQRPDRYRHIDALSSKRPLIARGGGYSYSAASFGEQLRVQEMTKFDRFLEFDEQKLTLKLESGVRLIDLLDWTINRELYFPVVPGYPLITVGGCVAADVHGKNPYRDGTFCDWVKEVTLFHPGKGYQTISPDSSPDLFGLTCGGFGLTGIITDLTLQLTELPSNYVDIIKQPVPGLAGAIALLSEDPGDFSYSWHDGAPGSSFGRGVIFSGRWSEMKSGDINLSFNPMTSDSRRKLPFSIWNSLTTRMANSAFYMMKSSGQEVDSKNLLEASFPFANITLYHRFFGRLGLREFQVLVGDDQIEGFLEELENIVSTVRPPTMMLSMKRFSGRQHTLSMTGKGFLVAIDCFLDDKTEKFFGQLDELMVRTGGQPNLAKDSRLPKAVAEQCIVHYDDFRGRLNAYDPSRLFMSELSGRLGL